MQFVKEHLHGSKFKLPPLCNAHTAPARLDKAARRGYNKTSEIFRQYRIILSADTASEVRQLLSQKRR